MTRRSRVGKRKREGSEGATVLQLRFSVLVERFLVRLGGKPQGVEVLERGRGTDHAVLREGGREGGRSSIKLSTWTGGHVDDWRQTRFEGRMKGKGEKRREGGREGGRAVENVDTMHAWQMRR